MAGFTRGGPAPLVFGGDGNVTLVSLDGKQRRALTKVSGGALARDPVWSPGRYARFDFARQLVIG